MGGHKEATNEITTHNPGTFTVCRLRTGGHRVGVLPLDAIHYNDGGMLMVECMVLWLATHCAVLGAVMLSAATIWVALIITEE